MSKEDQYFDHMTQSTQVTDRSKLYKLTKGHNYHAVLVLLSFCFLWYFLAHKVNNPFIFPYFENVMKAVYNALTDMYILRNIGITMRRVMTGCFYAFIIGYPLGMMMGYSKRILRTLSPFINSLRQIPIMAWVPLAIVWFGIGDGPTVFLIAFSGLFTIILNTISGVHDIDRDYYNAARSMGAKTPAVIKDVVLPGSMPGVITGLRLSIGLGWMSVI